KRDAVRRVGAGAVHEARDELLVLCERPVSRKSKCNDRDRRRRQQCLDQPHPNLPVTSIYPTDAHCKLGPYPIRRNIPNITAGTAKAAASPCRSPTAVPDRSARRSATSRSPPPKPPLQDYLRL